MGWLSEEWDYDLREYRRYGSDGVVVERRPFTADEIAAIPGPPPPTAAELRAEIAALPAPTMPADVLDVLDRALALLDGA